MQKEKLTRSIIEKDLIQVMKGPIKTYPVAWTFFLIIYIPLILAVTDSPNESLLPFIVNICMGGLTAYIVGCMIYSQVQIKKVKCGKYFVKTDELIRTEEGHSGASMSRLSFYKPHALFFKTSGKYELICQKNYSWSSLYTMTDKGILNTSIIGDSFILTGLRNQRILMVYNEKFFELQQEDL